MTSATFLYCGKLADSGEVFDDCSGEPLTITFGKTQVMPPIERALSEMEEGEEREVFVSADEGYGQREKQAIQRVLVQDVPNGRNLPVGEYILWKNPVTEHPIPVKVLSVHNGIAVFDMNHPLAGKDLIYGLELIERC
jgi:FKBP-type peptidyl-prolyl cis-trans isomerase 2